MDEYGIRDTGPVLVLVVARSLSIHDKCKCNNPCQVYGTGTYLATVEAVAILVIRRWYQLTTVA
jgi:hypothetical protein